MRCTQIFGLTDAAEEFLRENGERIVSSCCPHCNGVLGTYVKQEVYASAEDEGMFNDGPELNEYTLKDGRKIREIVQAVPWSSGPCIFLALVTTDGEVLFPWDDDEINNA